MKSVIEMYWIDRVPTADELTQPSSFRRRIAIGPLQRHRISALYDVIEIEDLLVEDIEIEIDDDDFLDPWGVLNAKKRP